MIASIGGPAGEPRLAWAWVAEPLPGNGLPEGFRQAFHAEGPALRPDPAGTPWTLVPVSSYRHLPPRRRPAAYCPVCLERVTLKLGRVLRAHFAHRAGSACAAARGEGALHLSAKLHLASALGGAAGRTLRFRRICAGVTGSPREACPRSPVHLLEAAWDAVAVERAVGAVRPDLVLLRGGRPVAALEVRVSSAVDARRGEHLARLGLPWLEVDARAVLPAAGLAWASPEPLDVRADWQIHPDGWRCPVCAPREAALQAMLRDGVGPIAWRPVHLHLRDAGRSGGEVRVRSFSVVAVERRQAGDTVEVWLERSDSGRRIAGPRPAADPATALAGAHELFRGWARRVRTERGAGVESPAGWTAAPPAGRLPQRLRWDAHAGRFRGVPNLPPLALPATAAGWSAPHPVLGYARCAWAERHPRRGLLTHAVAGEWWLTAAVHEWVEGGEPRCRADVAAFRHTGERWRPVEDASHEGPPRDWGVRLAAVADRICREGTLPAGSLAALLAADAAEPIPGEAAGPPQADGRDSAREQNSRVPPRAASTGRTRTSTPAGERPDASSGRQR